MKIDGNNDGFEGSPLLARTCKHCRWWASIGVTGIPFCDHEANVRRAKRISENGMTAAGEMSIVFTGPQFGCIHWEGK